MILKIKNIVSRLFSKSKLSATEERDQALIAPWIVLEITDLREPSPKVGRRLQQQRQKTRT